jgi:hypothetical protein
MPYGGRFACGSVSRVAPEIDVLGLSLVVVWHGAMAEPA